MAVNFEAFASLIRLYFPDVLFNMTTKWAWKDKTAGFRKQILENVVLSKTRSEYKEIGVNTQTAYTINICNCSPAVNALSSLKHFNGT